MMHIDGYQIHVERKDGTTFLVMQGRPYGMKAKLSLSDLEALWAELAREAITWQPQEPEPSVSVSVSS
jgi:hypothetical protein